MLSISPAIRIFVHAVPTDMRKSFNTLCALVTESFQKDVLKGDYFFSSTAHGLPPIYVPL